MTNEHIEQSNHYHQTHTDMSDNKKYFPEGFIFKEPHPNAPDFVKGQVSIKVEEFQRYLSKVKGEWLNLDLKIGRSGKPYAEVNTFKPDSNRQNSFDSSSGNHSESPNSSLPDNFDDMDDDLPFTWLLMIGGAGLMQVVINAGMV